MSDESLEPLLADRLRNDPRIVEAKRLMLEALREHQSALTGVRPADPQRKQGYDQTLKRFEQQRGGKLFYPYLGSGFGAGPLVELADGSVKYDMITGIGVHGFGHGDAGLVEAGLDAALEDVVMQGNLQQNVESEALGRLLLETATQQGAPLHHCFLSTSGAMANENALKILLAAKHPADRVLAFSGVFAGRSLACAAITDRAAYRKGLPIALPVDYVPFFDAADPAGSTERAVAVLRKHLERYPDRHAGMMMELVQGEGGYNVGRRDFFLRLIEVLKERGIPVLADEIQTFARTPRPFAFQHFGLDEHIDAATVGKITQVCATLFNDELAPGPGLISQTFTGATSSLRAARSIVERLTTSGYFGEDGRIMQVHRRFAEQFDRIAQRQPGWISGPYGLGGMIAFTALDGSSEATNKLLHRLFDNGVIAFRAGDGPVRVRMLPPIGVITDDQIDDVCGILERTLGEVA